MNRHQAARIDASDSILTQSPRVTYASVVEGKTKADNKDKMNNFNVLIASQYITSSDESVSRLQFSSQIHKDGGKHYGFNSLGSSPSSRSSSSTVYYSASSSNGSSQASFQPSNMLLRSRGTIPKVDNPFRGSNYQGDVSSKSFRRTCFNLPNHQNCSLFVTEIPANAKHRDVLGEIHSGPVWALHLMEATAEFPTKAGKLVFKFPESAAAVMRAGIRVGNHQLNIRYNREGQTERFGVETRVLILEGPEQIMTFEFWRAYFDEACIWDLDNWVYLTSGPVAKGNRRMEFRFGRVDGQAQTCLLKIKKDPCFEGVVEAKYGLDPCAQASFSSRLNA